MSFLYILQHKRPHASRWENTFWTNSNKNKAEAMLKLRTENATRHNRPTRYRIATYEQLALIEINKEGVISEVDLSDRYEQAGPLLDEGDRASGVSA